MATCRECKLFDIEAAKDKIGRIRKDTAVKCLWVSKEQYPDSVMMPHRPHASYVTRDDGDGCPCFQRRIGEKI